MRQALHIFRKDARFLRGEITLVLALIALLGYVGGHLPIAAGPAELLVGLAANFLIARVIHAEAIPGHNQFWVTRPYRWKSLIGAKILFVLLFVNLPLLVGQCYAISVQNFSFAASLPGLLWSQALTIVCLSLPVMCIASLTSGLIPLMVTEFIVVAEVFIGQALVGARLSWTGFLPGARPGPAAADWVRDFLVMTIVTAVAVFVLRSQYKTRRTEFGRTRAVQGLALAAFLFLFLPWPFLLRVQAAVSQESFDSSPLRVMLAPVTKSVFPGGARKAAPDRTVSLPFVVQGVPGTREAEIDAMSVTLEGGDGQTWKSGIVAPIPVESAETIAVANLQIDPAFLALERARPVTVRARFYITLFGDARSVTIPIQPRPVEALDGLRCGSNVFDELYCRSIFRWPRRRVYAKAGKDGIESDIRAISYSPFPATLGFAPIEQHTFSGTPAAAQATITTKIPLSHFSMDASLAGVLLNGYTAEAKRQAMTAPPIPR